MAKSFFNLNLNCCYTIQLGINIDTVQNCMAKTLSKNAQSHLALLFYSKRLKNYFPFV